MSDEAHYPLIEVNGTPLGMGLQHGRQARDRIRHTVQAMREHVGAEPCDASWDDFQRTVEYCRANVPHLVEETEGIAEGAGIEFREAFLINAHLDLLNWKRLVWAAQGGPAAPGCSSHAVVTESEVLLGWNGDDWRTWMECGVLVRGTPDTGEPFLYWSLAGSVGRPGISRHLALGANSVPSPRWRADGLLYPMLCRVLLDCRSAGEALGVFDTYQRCSAMNYMVADRAGDLVDVESTDDRHVALRPQDFGSHDHLLHTNCYLDDDLAGGQSDDPGCPRLAAARRLYAQRTPANADEMREVLTDHTGGICVHRGDACTIVSFVAEVKAGRLHATRGNPCGASASTYALQPHRR